jgi:hypothetical protein
MSQISKTERLKCLQNYMVSKTSSIKSICCANRGLSAEYWLRSKSSWISFNELKVQFAKRNLLNEISNLRHAVNTSVHQNTSRRKRTLLEGISITLDFECVLQTCTLTSILIFSTVSNIYSCCVRAFVSNAWQWNAPLFGCDNSNDDIGSGRYLKNPGTQWNHCWSCSP